jgi:hypothetical protein
MLCETLTVTSNPGSAWAKWFRRPEFPAKIAIAGRTRMNWRDRKEPNRASAAKNICALRFPYVKVLKRLDMKKEDLPYPKQRSPTWLHMLVYSLVVADTVYAVVDIDCPRSGWIRLDGADNALVKLRDGVL